MEDFEVDVLVYDLRISISFFLVRFLFFGYSLTMSEYMGIVFMVMRFCLYYLIIVYRPGRNYHEPYGGV